MSWNITKIASLGCDTVTSCTPNRKFQFRPDVVLDNGIYYIAIGSGDREKPISGYTWAYGVSNLFFVIKDKPTDSTWLSSEAGNCGSSIICKASLLNIGSSTDATCTTPSTTALSNTKGWYLGLFPHEQVVTAPITAFGDVVFSTHTPATSAAATYPTCESNLGTARVYNLHYTDATSTHNGSCSRYDTVVGGGLSPSPVVGQVTLDDGTTTNFCIGCGGKPANQATGSTATSFLEANEIPNLTTSGYPNKIRNFWYIQQ